MDELGDVPGVVLYVSAAGLATIVGLVTYWLTRKSRKRD